jgi:hypothetical protein
MTSLGFFSKLNLIFYTTQLMLVCNSLFIAFMKKIFLLLVCHWISFYAFSQDEFEYSAKEIQKRRISKIQIWEQQAAWDNDKFVKQTEGCVYLEKEYDTKGRLIAITENYCPERMHYRGDYYMYDNFGRIIAYSKSEYGIGEVEFRGIRYENLFEYDSIVYDQGLKQIKIIEFDANKKVVNRKTYQDTTLQESHQYIYNAKGLLVSESGMHRKVEFQKLYQYNAKDSVIIEKVYQGNELVQKEVFEYNNDGTRKIYQNINYQDGDSLVQRIQYEYFNKLQIRKITVSENDEKGAMNIIEVTEFDKAGNMIEKENRFDSNNPTSQEFSYTDKNQLKNIVWKQNGKTFAEATYKYNARHLLTDYEYKENGESRTITYLYDQKDLLTERIFKTDGKFVKKYQYTYAYFE